MKLRLATRESPRALWQARHVASLLEHPRNLSDADMKLIADTGGLIGVMTPEGRALNRERGAGFVALNWLENDGDRATQEGAHSRWATSGSDWPIIALRGQKAADGVTGCEGAKWLVMNINPASVLQFEGCEVLTPASLQKTGAIALYARDGALQSVTARQITGTRLWNAQ